MDMEWLDGAKRFGRYYRAALSYAFDGAWGVIGTVTTVVPIIIAFLGDDPDIKAAWPWLATASDWMGWKIPVAIGFAVLLVRFLVTAPYRFYRIEQMRGDALDDYIKPKLSVRLDKAELGCRVETKVQQTNQLGQVVAVYDAAYWRIKVMSETMKPIRKCTGFITKIVGPSGVVMGHESVQLTFADGSKPLSSITTCSSNWGLRRYYEKAHCWDHCGAIGADRAGDVLAARAKIAGKCRNKIHSGTNPGEIVAR